MPFVCFDQFHFVPQRLSKRQSDQPEQGRRSHTSCSRGANCMSLEGLLMTYRNDLGSKTQYGICRIMCPIGFENRLCLESGKAATSSNKASALKSRRMDFTGWPFYSRHMMHSQLHFGFARQATFNCDVWDAGK